jgi:SARP family transcriptional regulator, regulator of embCAB operon
MLRIYLNGEICLTVNDRLLRADRLPGRQGRLVFAYLVTERARAVSRDELSEGLWPRQLPGASDVALSAIVSKLRAVFAELGLERETVLATSGGYQLALPAGSWVDTEAALDSVHLAEAALQASNPRAAYGPSVVACAILRRPFMPSEEGAWVDGRREALRKNLLRSLDCLAQIHSATGELSLALRAAEEAVDLEPLREAGYRRLMLVHDAAGNRAEAVRVYAKLKRVLEVELMTTPGPETRRVFEAVAGRGEIGST